MKTLLNDRRPLVYCPGCDHANVVQALNRALMQLKLSGNQVVIVTDIGCSGLFDTFYNTHALHGLHGRSLTYATGLKLARPELTVIAVMGDGGMGIGGAHVIASCRRNLDINLLVLNNFNYGMTGGQCSVSTPQQATTSSGFLNQLEQPLDFCKLAETAGASWVGRFLPEEKELAAGISEAVCHHGFSVLEVETVCTGRYARGNPRALREKKEHEHNPLFSGVVSRNERLEYGDEYRRLAAEQPAKEPFTEIAVEQTAAIDARCEIMLLGAAGQRMNTAGEILCFAAMAAGLQVTRKSDYPITVLRGHSVCEVVCSPQPIRYTGIARPDVILALAPEGVERKRSVFESVKSDCLIIKAADVEIPPSQCRIIEIDFQQQCGITFINRGVAALAVLSCVHPVLNANMFRSGLFYRLKSRQLEMALVTAERISSWFKENPP
ncbi:thiamine pyrophosphate-dependent enzyme [Desulfosediminicola sp.]|uniref:thiamine pyrophosphate-dependent enzyme n=1 Tax=Desulfosediminicola sp. TaxID=2886825 RepID=UPI003AF23F66